MEKLEKRNEMKDKKSGEMTAHKSGGGQRSERVVKYYFCYGGFQGIKYENQEDRKNGF